jgi:uncharacterized membrane protein
MGIGLGIVLIVLGAILLWALDPDVDLPFIESEALGVILMAAGLLAIILALVMNAQRSRTKHTVEERRYGDRY